MNPVRHPNRQEREMWRWVIMAALVPYAFWLIFAYDYHFIDHVNLVFHEAGHVIFTPFGQTMHFLGGTIGQLFFPVAVAVNFWRQDQRFEAGLGGVWFAESGMYAAHYMGDAQARVLPLVGGGIHDWHFLFSRWGVLAHAERIAGFFHFMACLLLVASLIFMYRQLTVRPPVDDAIEPPR